MKKPFYLISSFLVVLLSGETANARMFDWVKKPEAVKALTIKNAPKQAMAAEAQESSSVSAILPAYHLFYPPSFPAAPVPSACPTDTGNDDLESGVQLLTKESGSDKKAINFLGGTIGASAKTYGSNNLADTGYLGILDPEDLQSIRVALLSDAKSFTMKYQFVGFPDATLKSQGPQIFSANIRSMAKIDGGQFFTYEISGAELTSILSQLSRPTPGVLEGAILNIELCGSEGSKQWNQKFVLIFAIGQDTIDYIMGHLDASSHFFDDKGVFDRFYLSLITPWRGFVSPLPKEAE